jgi:hypothetical protein
MPIEKRPRPQILVLILFPIALGGIAWQVITVPVLAHQLLALALLMLGIDQTRMAIVDLSHIQTLQQRAIGSPALQRFAWVTGTTIGLELLGFGLSWQWLSGGTAVVLFSQLWFNLLAGVQLLPESEPPIQDFGIKDRAIVLLADGLGLLLAVLYTLAIAPLTQAIGLLSMVLLYGCIKYLPIQSA